MEHRGPGHDLIVNAVVMPCNYQVGHNRESGLLRPIGLSKPDRAYKSSANEYKSADFSCYVCMCTDMAYSQLGMVLGVCIRCRQMLGRRKNGLFTVAYICTSTYSASPYTYILTIWSTFFTLFVSTCRVLSHLKHVESF
jgi:hypothetical protein